MFSPVGNQPSSVYWRRRILVLGATVVLVLLIVLTVRVAAGGSDGAGSSLADSTPTSSSTQTSSQGTSPSDTAARSAATARSSAQSSSSAVPGSSSPATTAPVSSAVPAACATSALAVQAVAGMSAYKVGQQPVVSMQVTNTGAAPCVQDLADKQIVLKVYNGESRVWGSHDCEVQPGTDARTLLANQPVRVSITWSARTSQEGCKGQRQRVGAGTYTLYAQLAGKSGKAAQFTIG